MNTLSISMSFPEIKMLLVWSLGINYALLLGWFFAFIAAHDTIYHLHTKWFRLSVETFDTIHHVGMSIYKISIILFNLVPLIALWLIR